VLTSRRIPSARTGTVAETRAILTPPLATPLHSTGKSAEKIVTSKRLFQKKNKVAGNYTAQNSASRAPRCCRFKQKSPRVETTPVTCRNISVHFLLLLHRAIDLLDV
jgi:hypothetical protein